MGVGLANNALPTPKLGCTQTGEMLMNEATLLPNQKYCLSVEEAARYSMIGEKKLRTIIDNDETLEWVLWVGSWVRIKRPQFEKWLDEQNYL